MHDKPVRTDGPDPRVSIIVPVYNGARYLSSTIGSVQAQTVTDWEMIVIDDGSQDESVAIARQVASQDSRISVFPQPNSGVAGARNAGYSKACRNSQYVVFLDQDDMWQPHFLETMIGALEKDYSAVAAYGLARFIDSAGQPIRMGELEASQRSRIGIGDGKRVAWDVAEPTTLQVTALWSYITTPGQVLIRRAALADEELFDPNTAPADDMDLWLRLTLRGPIRLIDRVVMDYRAHAENVSNDLPKMERAALRARRAAYRHAGLDAEQRKLIELGYRFVELDKLHVRISKYREAVLRRQYGEAAHQLRHAIKHFFLQRWGKL